jgi:hypothetical protein
MKHKWPKVDLLYACTAEARRKGARDILPADGYQATAGSAREGVGRNHPWCVAKTLHQYTVNLEDVAIKQRYIRPGAGLG